MAKNKTSIKKSLLKFVGLVDEVAEKEAAQLAGELEDSDMDETETPVDVSDSDNEHEEAEDKEEADALSLIKELTARIEALESLNKEEEVKDEDTSDSDVDEMTDSDNEEKADGEYAVGDSINTVISKVEILAPGAKLMTSLGDAKSTNINISQVKKQALKQVSLTDSELLTALLDGKSVDELTGDILNVTFNAAVALKKAKNNAIVTQPVFLSDSQAKEKYDPLAAATARYYASRQN